MDGFKGNIESLTINNNYFRRVIFTTEHNQLVVMSLKPKEEIGMEVHAEVDQFFRFEKGHGKVIINDIEHDVKDGDAVIVPAGSRHNIVNSSTDSDLKLYTIYSPPNHPDGTIHKTKAEAQLAEKEGH